jgi:hypothetical protein
MCFRHTLDIDYEMDEKAHMRAFRSIGTSSLILDTGADTFDVIEGLIG